jgi:hypothetical protein
VRRFQHNGDSSRIAVIFNEVRNRLGHSLLHLWASRDIFHDASQLAEPDNSAAWQVTDMSLASKWQQMMFAHATEFDVTNENDFVVVLCKDLLEVDRRILAKAGKHLGVHPAHPRRCLFQSVSIRIFADSDQNFAHGFLDSFVVHGAVASRVLTHEFALLKWVRQL